MTTEEPIQYASESGHWYDRNANPVHEVPYADPRKGMRPTTLRDARKLNLLPSVSSILKTIAKPCLDTWKVDQYLSTAYGMPAIETETEEEWIAAVRSKASLKMDICRDLGTEVHGAINRHFKREDSEERFDPFIEAAVNSLKEIGVWDKQTEQDLESERTFANLEYGFAGCIDGSLSGEPVIWDFKAIDNLSKKWDWPERLAQISGYLVGKYGPEYTNSESLFLKAKGYNIAISTNEPGKYAIREWSPEELVRGWEIFSAANKLWRALNQYEP